MGRPTLNRRAIVGKVRDRLKTWREWWLAKEVLAARQWLREVPPGP
jgi:hypothetical protein